MLTLKVAIQTASLRLPLKQALFSAAELGADAVELDARQEFRPGELSQTGLRQFRKMLEDFHLRVAALGFRTRRGYDAPDDLDRRVAATKQVMDLAYRLGAKVVVNQIGPVPGDDQSDRWRLLVAVLSDLGRYGDRCGARLAAVTGTESGADLARLLAALPEGAIAVTLDPGGLIVAGHSPVEAVTALGPAIEHVHARDAARDFAKGRGVEVPLGRGEADFPAILGALEQHDYRGYLSIVREGAEDPLGEISQSVQFLRNLVE